MSNYPAGVTGNEYEISGPEYSDSAIRYCDHCEDDREGTLEGHRDRGSWFICDECGETTDLGYPEEEGPDPDRQRDEQWDREHGL